MPHRRDFLAQLTALTAFLAVDPEELRASARTSAGPWDTSWIDKLKTAQYRVVFNASDVSDGIVRDYVMTFFDDFHTVHATNDADTRPVVVFRRNGTGMAFNDAMWDKYRIGEYAKVNDARTRAPATRNPYATDFARLTARGMISLVCNVATHGYSRGLAELNKLDADKVYADLAANLIPGAVLVPSGIFALIRAQNAGCAWMPGT